MFVNQKEYTIYVFNRVLKTFVLTKFHIIYIKKRVNISLIFVPIVFFFFFTETRLQNYSAYRYAFKSIFKLMKQLPATSISSLQTPRGIGRYNTAACVFHTSILQYRDTTVLSFGPGAANSIFSLQRIILIFD